MASPVEEDGEAAPEALKGSSSQLCGGVKTGDAVGRVRRESECEPTTGEEPEVRGLPVVSAEEAGEYGLEDEGGTGEG